MTTRARAVLLVAALVVLVAGGVASYVAASSVVRVRADGEARTGRTLAGDVGEVLEDLGVALAEADEVEPGLDAPVGDGLDIVVTRASSVDVHVDDRPARTVVAVADTVADVLRAGGFESLLRREARIDPVPGEPIADGGRIDVELPAAVTVAVDGAERELETYAATVGEALAEAGVSIGERDVLDTDPDEEPRAVTAITIRRVDVVEDVVEVGIDYGEQRRETGDLPKGENRVGTEGRDGLRRQSFEVTLVDGEEAERELLDEEVVREPTDRVVLVGTGPTPVEEAQGLLAELGYPVGPVDGIEGPQTRRGLCAWRRLEGREASRGPLRPDELEALRETAGLPEASSGEGVTVDRTCQALYYRKGGAWQRVHQASTGTDGLPREGSYRIVREREGWHTSTLYPAPEPNMYNSLYIRGAIAVHGSKHAPPQPASAGCVRVTPETADELFAALGVGDPVRVIGSY